MAKVLDGNVLTNWVTGSESPRLVVDLVKPTRLSSYVLTSGKDRPSMDPGKYIIWHIIILRLLLNYFHFIFLIFFD
jgi:hypothetical protein